MVFLSGGVPLSALAAPVIFEKRPLAILDHFRQDEGLLAISRPRQWYAKERDGFILITVSDLGFTSNTGAYSSRVPIEQIVNLPVELPQTAPKEGNERFNGLLRLAMSSLEFPASEALQVQILGEERLVSSW